MAVHVLDAMAREGFEQVVALHDAPSGLRAFLGIHDTSRGPAFGGIRRFTYRDEKSGLVDCLRLAKAMSLKCALAGVAGGGAKLVIFDAPELDLEGAYEHVGRVIEGLGGRYYAGPDVGTGTRELEWVGRGTAFVTRPRQDGLENMAAATAAGVFAGMKAALRHLDGEERWPERRVVIQGLGSVGWRLAERLIGLGARVGAVDLDEALARRARTELGVEVLESGAELDQPCDVFAPCAMGGLLHDLSIQRLAARVICGAANNPIARSHHAERLHGRGVLYMPDFVVNSGAVILGAGFHLEGRVAPLDEIERRIEEIAVDILRRADDTECSPFAVAKSLAEETLAAAHAVVRPASGDTAPVGGASRDRATEGWGTPHRSAATNDETHPT